MITAVDTDSASMTWNAWVSLGTALACFAFVAAYAVLARWWTSYEGRVMMGKAVAIGLLSLYTFLVVEVVPESTAMRWARAGVMAAIGLFMVFQTARVVKHQINRQNRHRKQEV
jgi:membrane associated rhomboid family serine protease